MKVLKHIIRLPYVKETTAQLSLRGLIASSTATETTPAQGFDLQYTNTIKHSLEINKGMFMAAGDKYSIALGEQLAKKLNVTTGNNLTIMTTTRDGALNAGDVTVSAVIKTGIKEYDPDVSLYPGQSCRGPEPGVYHCNRS